MKLVLFISMLLAVVATAEVRLCMFYVIGQGDQPSGSLFSLLFVLVLRWTTTATFEWPRENCAMITARARYHHACARTSTVRRTLTRK